MKIILDQPLCIHEMGNRTMQQDSVVPAMGEAHATDRHFMVGEGPLADVYLQKASLTIHNQGITARYAGNCRIFQIRPGFDAPIYASTISPDQASGDAYENIFSKKEHVDQLTDIQTGDWLLAMTDGMCEFFDIEDIIGILTRPDWTAAHKRDALLDYTSANEDNHSAYLLHVRNVEETEVEEQPIADAEENLPESVTVVAMPDVAEETAITENAPTRLNPVIIETDLQNQDIDLKETSSSVFDVSAKSLMYLIVGAYVIAMCYGFFKGLFG